MPTHILNLRVLLFRTWVANAYALSTYTIHIRSKYFLLFACLAVTLLIPNCLTIPGAAKAAKTAKTAKAAKAAKTAYYVHS
jgi:hypothetical protein